MMPDTGAALRIGDAERDAAATSLSDHFAAGRLTKDEFDERLEHAWRARTQADLAPLFADLPSPERSTPAGARRASATSRDQVRTGWRDDHRPARSARVERCAPPFAPLVLIAVIISIVSVANGGRPWPLFILGALWLLGVVGSLHARRTAWVARR